MSKRALHVRRLAVHLVLLAVAASTVPLAMSAEPPVTEPAATPRATCGPGSKPETGRQGRVPPEDRASGRSALGYSCNTTLLSSYGTAGGYKTLRYVDVSGRECAYFDVPPTTAQPGVRVLDMSNPRKPELTATLTTPAMRSPHESLELNPARGLLVAVMGTATTAPGVIDIYDLTQDCRKPVLKSSLPVGGVGHESGLAVDGRTFYSASAISGTIVAVDISNPSLPVPLLAIPMYSHGLSLSDDGNRAYLGAFPPGVLAPPGPARQAAGAPGLTILDVSEIQARKTAPQVRVVSRLQWPFGSLPQNVRPLTVAGRPYLLEFDEFADLVTGDVGAARLIDIADEMAPRVVSNLRLEVNQSANRASQVGDVGASSGLGGYSAHYCSIPRSKDPGLAACSFILSGLRVFDISNPLRPREVAYDSPPQPGNTTAKTVSAPVVVPERREVWYTDGAAGLRVVRLNLAATSAAAPARAGSAAKGSAPGREAAAPAPPSALLPATGPATELVGLAVLVLLGAAALTRHRRRGTTSRGAKPAAPLPARAARLVRGSTRRARS